MPSVARATATSTLTSVGAVVSTRLTAIGLTASMPLPGTSLTASAVSSTVILVSVLRNAVVSVISTLVLLAESIAAPVVVWSVPPFFTVILVLSTVPMASLKVRTTFVRSPEAFALDSVGFTPSTLWLAEAATAAWVSTASRLAPAVALIVPPLASSLLAAMEMPSVSSSLAATVYPENTSAVPGLPAE